MAACVPCGPCFATLLRRRASIQSAIALEAPSLTAGARKARRAAAPLSFKTYIHKVFKAAHPDNSMNSKAMAVVDTMLLDLSKQVAAAASDAVTKANARSSK